MSEELKPQEEPESDQLVTPEELSEQDLKEIAGGNAGGTGLHAPGGPPSP